MTSWAAQLNAVTLFVDDLPAARQFYRDVFDLPVHFEDPNSAVFKFGSVLINLLDVRAADELVAPATVGDVRAGVSAVMTIGVDEVDSVVDIVTARGAELLNGPMDRPWGVRTASFCDPAGHVWEIAGPIR
ncbi:MAG TPA: VOC family protein [Jatrophihabitans sp.]|jgi:catechol 2,3-dioxygenase-like lactoylglutathione lyase family enzyme|nr:VOC family protein [Jatrophihabitans sp.]